MFFKKKIPLDRPIQIKGKDLLPLIEKQSDEVDQVVSKLDLDIESLGIREGTPEANYRRQLIREQSNYVVQKEWLSQLQQVVEPRAIYLLTLGEARTLGLLNKKNEQEEN